jgi:hypothetical protein
MYNLNPEVGHGDMECPAPCLRALLDVSLDTLEYFVLAWSRNQSGSTSGQKTVLTFLATILCEHEIRNANVSVVVPCGKVYRLKLAQELRG